jgi:Domain of unknown function (DUF4157)
MIVRTRTSRTEAAPPIARHARRATSEPFAAIRRMQARAGNRATVAATSGPTPLPAETRAEMEASFGADLSAVRVSENSNASRAGAEAVTEGNHIEFAPGRFNPSSGHGRFLLGHELTHVLQQRGGRVAERQGNRGRLSQHGDLEAEADRIGSVVAQGRAARVPGAPTTSQAISRPVAQGYVVYDPAAANPAVGNYQANTTFNAQEEQGGNFLDPATNTPRVVASGLGANTPVRISSNGWIAIEDADLGHRQAKYFFTDQAKIRAWNKSLMAAGSFFQLRENNAETVSFDWNGAARVLVRVDAVNLYNATAGDQLKSAQNCDAMVKEVIGAASSPVPKLGRATATQPPAAAAFRAMYEESLQQYFVADDLAGGNLMAGHDYQQNPAQAGTIENNVADTYGTAMHAHKGAAADPALDQRAQQLGVNEYAAPGVGEAFVTHRLGSAPKNTPVPDQYHNRTENNPSKATLWGEHWGGVIGKDGPDTVTLENYARNAEDPNYAATTAEDQRFYFQMYGSGAQSWHEKWAEFHAGQRNFANPVTMAVTRGHVNDDLASSHHADRARLHFGNGAAVADDIADVTNAVDEEELTIAVYKAMAFAKNAALSDIGPVAPSRTGAWTTALMNAAGNFPGSRQLCVVAADLLSATAAQRWKADAAAAYANQIDQIKDHHVLLAAATQPSYVLRQLRKGLAYGLDHVNGGRKGRKQRVRAWIAAAKAVPRSAQTAGLQALVVQTLMAVKT